MASDGPLHKTDFGAIYDQPDPRAYFSSLEPFDYLIPQHGAELFAGLLAARGTAHSHEPRILDVCCSYGVVATLMKTGMDLAAVNAHYREAAAQGLTPEQLVDVDRRLLKDHPGPGRATFVGLDVAPNAIAYARATGALDAGVVENLEVDPPSAELASLMSEVDLIVTTGGVGYVTERTFDRLLDLAPDTVLGGRVLSAHLRLRAHRRHAAGARPSDGATSTVLPAAPVHRPGGAAVGVDRAEQAPRGPEWQGG